MAQHHTLQSQEELVEKVIYGISIFFADSAYEMVSELDQQLVVITLMTVAALVLNYFKTHVKQHAQSFGDADVVDVGVWWSILSRWFETFSMISAFIAIQGLVKQIMNIIEQNERYRYEVVLYPILTIMISIALITVTHAHFTRPELKGCQKAKTGAL